MNDSHESLANRALNVPSRAVALAGPGERLPSALVSPQQNQSMFTPRLVWNVLQGRWKIALPLGIVLACAAAAIVWVTFKPEYRAEAWLRIEDRRPFIAFPIKDDSGLFVPTQVELLRGPRVLGEVVTALAAEVPEIRTEEDPHAWLREHLKVEPVGHSELYLVAFTNHDRNKAAKIANAIVQAHLHNAVKEEAAETERVLELLRDENKLRQKNLEKEREDLRNLMKQAGYDEVAFENVTSATRSEPVPMTLLGSLEARLSDAEVEREILEAQVKARSQTAGQPVKVPDSLIEQALAQNAELLELGGTLRLKQQDVPRAKEGSALRQDLERQIADLQSKLTKRREELRPQLAEELRALVEADAARATAELQERLANQRLLEELLKQRVEQERSRLQEKGDRSLDFVFARAELVRSEEVIRKIADREVVLSTESRAPERVTLLRSAEPPTVPVETWPYKRLIPAVALGMFLPFGLLVLWEALAKKILGSDQLGQETHLPVIGEVATLPAKPLLPRPGAKRRYERDLAVFRESVHSIGTALAVSEAVKDRKVLVIASAVSGEGKTSLAAQLATGWARSGGNAVLVMDCDMRSPGIAESFGVDSTPGLVEVLRGECELDDAINTEWGEGIHILPAGRLGSTSPHLLARSQTFGELLGVLRERYQRIVIDVAPILAASESMHVAKLADGVVLCALRDHSRAGHVRLACQRLLMAGIQPIGTVLNGIPARQYMYRYGAYYGSYVES
ncbi:MAG: AAA family ATPase [Planctomycetes bacterium]|nr:AAA family ATPase [Planctomycetota bacterium]